MRIDVIEAGDPAWDEHLRSWGMDPHSGRAFLSAATPAPARAVLVHASGVGWAAREALILTPLDHGRALARSPLYGGPWVSADPGLADSAAAEFRKGLDRLLVDLGVVSEVTLMSPWTPEAHAVDACWSARPDKVICLTNLARLEERLAEMGSARRSEIRRGAQARLDVRAFDEPAAQRFAGVYVDAMEVKGAADRWRLGDEEFRRLAVHAGHVLRLATCEGEGGGAAALFLFGESSAAYLYAARWGNLPGASAAALWQGASALAAEGMTDLLLGGGVTGDEDDPLLRFKMSFATTTSRLRVAARLFDADAHDTAVGAGFARPLPAGAVSV